MYDDEREPLAERGEFDRMLREIVDENTPRLFVITQEVGDRVEGRIACWGMAFADRAVLIPDWVDSRGAEPVTVASTDRAVALHCRVASATGPGVRAQLRYLSG